MQHRLFTWIGLYAHVACMGLALHPTAAQTSHAPLTMPRQRVVQSCGAALVTKESSSPFSLSTIVGLNSIGTLRKNSHKVMMGFWIPFKIITSSPDDDVVAGARAWAWPNPFRDNVSIDVFIPMVQHAHADIFDVHGTLVHSIVGRELRSDGVLFSWNGLDAKGTPVANGLYTVRVLVRQFSNQNDVLFTTTVVCNR